MSTQFLCAIATVHGVLGALKMPPRPDHAAESACHDQQRGALQQLAAPNGIWENLVSEEG